jgi:G6PDH family F420-dependent oxidoreductase
VTTQFGYALSSEEHGPADLVRNATRAEEAGFEFATISDHFHPWIDNQGHSPFVWSVLGAIAQATQKLTVGTAVTCPTIRTHPAVIAHAAATTADLMPGRFFLGLGTGEALNEHVTGERWPSADERRDMLAEAIDVIRKLWTGEMVSHEGAYFTLVDARIYSIPESLPPIYIAAGGKQAAKLAAEYGDGLIATSPDPDVTRAFDDAGGSRKPRLGQVKVVWHKDEAEARRIAMHNWPTSAVPGELGQELPLPRHFEQAAQLVTEDELAKHIICGADVAKHIKAFAEYVDAGFTHVYVHQVGPEQSAFFEAYQREVLPELRKRKGKRAA